MLSLSYASQSGIFCIPESVNLQLLIGRRYRNLATLFFFFDHYFIQTQLNATSEQINIL